MSPAARGLSAEQIADELRELIASGALAPGLPVRQEEIAERFGVSRVPTREALKILLGEGLLQHRAGRGFAVAPLSSDEGRQLYLMRHLLEVEVLKTIEWPNREQLDDLKVMVDRVHEAAVAGDVRAWTSEHRAFHRAVFELSPETVLVREVMRLWSLTDRYRAQLAQGRLDATSSRGERRLLTILRKRSHLELLELFEAEREAIEKRVTQYLEARGV